MIMRIRFKKLGAHVHCRVFTASQAMATVTKMDMNTTFALNGELVFAEDEWFDVHAILSKFAHVIPEDGHDGRGEAIK